MTSSRDIMFTDSSFNELIISYGITDDFYSVMAVKTMIIMLSHPQYEKYHRPVFQV